MDVFSGLVKYRKLSNNFCDTIVAERNAEIILKFLQKYRVLSGYQLSLMMPRVSERKIKNSLKILFKIGFVDRYQAEKGPYLYTLSTKGAELMKTEYQEYDTLDLVRTVMINQLFIWMKIKQPMSILQHRGKYALLRLNRKEYIVLAPRAGESEILQAIQIIKKVSAIKDIGGTIVIATDIEAAYRISALSVENIRYTWDKLLKGGATIFFFDGTKFVEDLKILPEEVDSDLMNMLLSG